MKSKLWLLSCFIVALTGGPAATQAASLSGQSLTLPRALEDAEAANPDLAAVRWNMDIADGGHQQASLLPNPEASWYSEDTGTQGEVTVAVTQKILTGGKRSARMEVAAHGQSIAALQFEQQRNQLRADIIEAFYAALIAQEQLKLAEQNRAVAERGLSVANTQVQAGRSSPIEARRSQVQLAEVSLGLNRAQRDLTVAYRNLTALLGSSVPPFRQVEGNIQYFPPVPAEEILLDRLKNTRLLQLAARQIEQNEASVALEKANRIPDLAVTLGNKRLGEVNRNVLVVGVSLPLPLFDRNQGNIYAASKRVGQSRDVRNATELRLQAETRQSLAQWQAALISVHSLSETIIPAARQTLDNITRGFEAGKFEFIDVLDAQRTLLSARTEYLQAVGDVTRAWAQIERIYGDAFVLKAR